MQITVKEARVVKTGTNKSGEWELIRVTSEDKTEYTTFDKKAKHLTSGSVIDFEPIIKEGKLSFKEFTLISEGQVSPAPGASMTPEAWAQKQRIERESIENQVRAKLIVELRIAGVIDDKHNLYKKCLVWLDTLEVVVKPKSTEQESETQASIKPSQIQASAIKTALGEVEFDSSPIENFGALWTRCKNYDIPKAEGLELLELTDQSEIVDLDEAWKTIFTRKFKKEE